jgi:hypothetical protein
MKWDAFITLLRKLGILRFGTKEYKYTSGKDMPAEALMDDVIDPEKDIMFDLDKRKKEKKDSEKK